MWKPLKETDIEALSLVREQNFNKKIISIAAIIFGIIIVCLLWLFLGTALGLGVLVVLIVLYLIYGRQKLSNLLNKYLTVDINQCMVTDAIVISVEEELKYSRRTQSDYFVYHLQLKTDDGIYNTTSKICAKVGNEVWLYCNSNIEVSKLHDKFNRLTNSNDTNISEEYLFIRHKDLPKIESSISNDMSNIHTNGVNTSSNFKN